MARATFPCRAPGRVPPLSTSRNAYRYNQTMSTHAARLPAVLQWTTTGRVIVFALSATSIWCLLAELYGLLSKRMFFYANLLPATGALYGTALLDRFKGDRAMWHTGGTRSRGRLRRFPPPVRFLEGVGT